MGFGSMLLYGRLKGKKKKQEHPKYKGKSVHPSVWGRLKNWAKKEEKKILGE